MSKRGRSKAFCLQAQPAVLTDGGDVHSDLRALVFYLVQDSGLASCIEPHLRNMERPHAAAAASVYNRTAPAARTHAVQPMQEPHQHD